MNPTTMTPEQFLNDVWSTTVWVVKGIIAVAPVMALILPFIFKWWGARIKDARHQQAFDTVSRMGLLAANAAVEELSRGMKEATDETSPGGVTVTQAEMLAIIGRAGGAAFKWAEEQHVLKAVLDVYGGEDKVKASLFAMINNKLHGTPVGAPVTVLAPPAAASAPPPAAAPAV